jgi:membrane protease YdiL (CAAX protease family)
VGPDVALLAVLFVLLVVVFQELLAYFFNERIRASPDRKGLEMVVYGFALHGGGLLAWPAFFLLRHRISAGHQPGSPAGASPAPPPARWLRALRDGGVTLLVALPLVYLVSMGWTFLLTLLGRSAEPQDLIATFQNTRSPSVLAGMFFIACVLAPVNEEMIFRRGLYHFFRQRFGRSIALAFSASLFGLLHWNLAGFLPLAALGVILALAYERTGDIRVPIIAHGLFNLNTIIALLAGLSG